MIQELKKTDFDRVFKIMEASFSLDEIRSYQEEKDLLERPCYKIYVSKDSASGQVQGFAALWDLETYAYLEHLAIDPQLRGRGLGTQVLRDLASSLKKRLCLEVEAPEDGPRKKRIDFYKKSGLSLNPYSFIQPPLARGKSPLTYLIMSSGGQLNKEGFVNFRKEVYKEVHGLDYDKIKGDLIWK